MSNIEIIDDENYKVNISKLKPGEKVECPDHTSKVEKIPEGCKITLNKAYQTKKL